MLFRRAMRYPPVVSLINAVVRARTFAAAMDDASHIVGQMRQQDPSLTHYRVLGPAPAPLGKLRGEYRVQLLVKGTNRKRMRETLVSIVNARPELARPGLLLGVATTPVKQVERASDRLQSVVRRFT